MPVKTPNLIITKTYRRKKQDPSCCLWNLIQVGPHLAVGLSKTLTFLGGVGFGARAKEVAAFIKGQLDDEG